MNKLRPPAQYRATPELRHHVRNPIYPATRPPEDHPQALPLQWVF